MNKTMNFSTFCKVHADDYKNILSVVIHKINRDNANTAENNAYMEVRISDMICNDNNPLIMLEILSNLGDHITNTNEWHDLLWASNWVVEYVNELNHQ